MNLYTAALLVLVVLTLALAFVIRGKWSEFIGGKLGEHEARIENLERALAQRLGLPNLPWREDG